MGLESEQDVLPCVTLPPASMTSLEARVVPAGWCGQQLRDATVGVEDMLIHSTSACQESPVYVILELSTGCFGTPHG
jgi:hypothetical protein